MHIPIRNPYPDAPPGQENHKVSGRVSPDDYRFIKLLFPMTPGITDKIIATLYKKLNDELRRINATNPIEQAWERTHSTHTLLAELLDGCSFGRRSLGGRPGPRDVTGGVDELHSTVQRPAKQRANPKGLARPGGRGKTRSEKEGGKKG